MNIPDTACFISDAHLGVDRPGREESEKNLLAFLASLQGRVNRLFIVGDLFDFWIEYANAIRPVYFPVLHALRCCIESGITVHYLGGNHDFALGTFLEKIVGIQIHFDHLHVSLQGRSLHLHHGDGLVPGEIAYRLLRKILRNPFNQRLYRLLHPDIGIPLANYCSFSSRYLVKRSCDEHKLGQYRRVARRYLSEGSDIVVFGHTHSPEIIDYNGKVYCNTGDWMRNYTYAMLEGGAMALWQYRPGSEPRRIQAAGETNTR